MMTLLIAVVLTWECLLPGRTYGEEKNQTNNFVEQKKAGIVLQLVENRIIVKSLTPNSPAEKAGILAGDAVLTVDGRSFPSVKEVMDHISSKKKGERVVFAVERKGKMHTFEVVPVTIKVRPTVLKLQSLLLENKKVVLAVVVSDVKSTFDMKREVYDSWAEGIRHDEQTTMEGFYLKNLGRNSLFSIVDRSRTKAILNEYRLNQTGLVSETMRLKIGEMTGATHLLDVNFARYKNPQGYTDAINARIIDISSGTVMAVDQMRIKHKEEKRN
jgi:membrane-associated protease RseP (regulator of RpoE activity)